MYSRVSMGGTAGNDLRALLRDRAAMVCSAIRCLDHDADPKLKGRDADAGYRQDI